MFHSDQPIKNLTEDLFGRNFFAEAVANAILSYQREDSVSIGLFGEWGSGKTSIINMMVEKIRSISPPNEPIIIKFNPWNFSDQNQLIQQFFSELSVILGRDDLASKYKKIGNKIQKYSKFFEPLSYVPALTTLGAAAKGISAVAKAAESAGKEESKNLSEIKNELNLLLKDIESKLVIIIDDIDRLNNTEIRQIFQLVKSLADFPNTIYILSFDKKIVMNALSKVQEDSGKRYLEKIIQVPFEVPQLSREELEDYLFKQLDDILQDLSDDEWEQTRWGNIYFSGLKHLIHNMRDVNRFLNSLHFGFGLVKGAVNPIDFIAVTGIQVFLPELYKDIQENKSLFTGKNDSVSMLQESREEEEARITSILGKVNELKKDALRNFLRRLFPKLDSMRHSGGFLRQWRKEGRVCSPEIFDTYFKLSISKNELSLNEIERILSTAKDETTFKEELLKLNEEDRIISFIERMEDYTEHDIDKDNIAAIVNVLMDIGDLFPYNSDGYFASIPNRIRSILLELSYRFQTHDERFELFKDAINNSEGSLLTIVKIVDCQCIEHGIYDYGKESLPLEECTVNAKQAEELVGLALQRIEEWARSEKLVKHNSLRRILYLWRRLGADEKVRKYAQSLTKDDKGLIRFLEHFLATVQSSGISDYVPEISWRMNLNKVGDFLDLDDVDERLRKIQENPKYNELGEKEKRTIDTFLNTRDG